MKYCQTDKPVQNRTHISLGQYDAKIGKYRILLSVPIQPTTAKVKYLRDEELIQKKKELKQKIKDGQVFAEISYPDQKSIKGEVGKYSGSIIRIKTEAEIEFDIKLDPKTKKVKLFDQEGIQISDPYMEP